VPNEKLPWAICAFLFAVFAVSSWNVPLSRSGYDAADVNQLSESARTGSLGRQAALPALGVFAVASLARRRRHNTRPNRWAVTVVCLYVIWVCASVAWTVDVDLTAKAAARFVFMCLGALAIAERLSIRQLALVTFTISGLTLLSCLLYEVSTGSFNPGEPSWRLSGLMHPVSQGWNCSLLTISSLYLSRCSRTHPQAYRVALVLGVVSLALTKSRLAFAATLATVAIDYVWHFSGIQKVAAFAASGSGLSFAMLTMGYRARDGILAFGRGVDGKPV
jgi:hypothetical protein